MGILRIYRPSELYNRNGKRGLLNVGKTHFYDVIKPQLERIALGERAAGYTGRSVRKVIAAGIAKSAVDRHCSDVTAAA
jgi:hypothetical protein